jgi:hypothetical protein
MLIFSYLLFFKIEGINPPLFYIIVFAEVRVYALLLILLVIVANQLLPVIFVPLNDVTPDGLQLPNRKVSKGKWQTVLLGSTGVSKNF